MTDITRLRATVAPAKRQCCIPIDEATWNNAYAERRRQRCAKIGLDPSRCTNWASHEINGKFYCGIHAGKEALRMLMETDQ